MIKEYLAKKYLRLFPSTLLPNKQTNVFNTSTECT